MSHSVWKAVGITLLSVVGAVLLAVLAYVLYVILSYSRIPDRQPLTPDGDAPISQLSVGKSYVAMTQNVGFGAYTPDFTFFMDGGKESRAASRKSVENCTRLGIDTLNRFNPDFILLQEVDTDSTRSHHVNQQDLYTAGFPGYTHIFACNFHSSYLMYPILEPHGASNSGLLTFSRGKVTSSLRRSFPISTSLSKFTDLDRCYAVNRIPVDNGKELVLYNIHTSAYGGSDQIRTDQITMLMNDMLAEYKAGNYVVGGGDFNHDFTGDSTKKLNEGDRGDFGWAQPFPANLIPEGLHRCLNYKDGVLLPTCRNCDVPYKPGNTVFVVDGFFVSDNVEAVEVENIQTGFAYSDHQPVKLTFQLK